MKANTFLLLILMLICSRGFAQVNTVISINNTNEITSTSIKIISKADVNTNLDNTLIKDKTEVKQIIARSSSDIRIYLNRKRKISNFNIVFQKKYKAIRA